MCRNLLVILGLLVFSTPVAAQSASDCTGLPTTAVEAVDPTPVLEFGKSADHDAVVTGTTTPLLTNYAVAICTGTTLTSQANLGKPTPNATGVVSVPVPNAALLARNTAYYVVLYASGPGGTSKTGPVAPFVMAGPPAAVPAGSVVVRP